MGTRADLSRLRRQAVIDATADLIRTGGVDSLTVRQVAERANVAAGTIFLYFESKSDLVTHVLSEIVAARWHSVLDGLAELPPLDRVEGLYLGCVDVYYADFSTVGALYSGMNNHKNTQYPEIERLYARIRVALEEAKASGQIEAATDIEVLALSFRTLYSIVLNIAREGGSHSEARRALATAHSFIRHGVSAAPTA